MAKVKFTIHDIARELDLSPATVSRALNDNPRISQKTTEAVKKAASKMNYSQNRMAAGLRNGRSKMIGVIIPTANRNFFGNILRGIEQVAYQNGYAVLITQSNDDEKTEENNIKMLMQANVDGIFVSLSKTTKNHNHFKQVQDADVPLVFFDRIDESISCSSVVIDDYQISYKATQHLIEEGYRHIVHFAGPEYINIFQERMRGYEDALRDSDIEGIEPMVLRTHYLTLEQGRINMSDLLSEGVRVDAVFSASDFAAAGAMQVCKEKGIRVPDEIGFVGFANEPFTQLIDPALTTIDQRPEDIGRIAAKVFFEEIESAEEDYLVRRTVLNSRLIIRESSKKTSK